MRKYNTMELNMKRLHTKNILRFFIPTVLLFLYGCTTIEPKLSTDIETPQSYSIQHEKEHAIDSEWYKEFKSPKLNVLIEKAQAQSPQLIANYERIEQAKILLASAGALYLPSLDLRASTNAARNDSQNSERTNAEVALSYELDVWGKIAANIRASKESLNLSIYDYEALKLSLISNIATSYFAYQNTIQRAKIAKKNLAIAKQILSVMEARVRYGNANPLDVSRQKTLVYSEESNCVTLTNQAKIYKNALAVLVGAMPSDFDLSEEPLNEIDTSEVNAGLPSELLLRRPDIASARADIESSRALIQVADALRYPSFSLTGAAGLSSLELLSFGGATSSLSGGLGVNYNIFDDGRLTNARLVEESRARAKIEEYKRVILVAFQEVEDALNATHYTQKNLVFVEEILKESRYTFELSTLQYTNGLIDFTTYLQTQQSYFDAQERLILAKVERLNAAVNLYKALGGGFSIPKNQNLCVFELF